MIDNAAIFFGCAAMLFVAFRLVRASETARREKAAGAKREGQTGEAQ